MRDVYTAKLSRLSDEILEMGNLCGQAIMKTCQLLASMEVREAATKEIGRIEKEIDDKEHNIEALCMQLLLKQQKIWDWCIVLPGVFWGEGWKWRTFFKLEASGFFPTRFCTPTLSYYLLHCISLSFPLFTQLLAQGCFSHGSPTGLSVFRTLQQIPR